MTPPVSHPASARDQTGTLSRSDGSHFTQLWSWMEGEEPDTVEAVCRRSVQQVLSLHLFVFSEGLTHAWHIISSALSWSFYRNFHRRISGGKESRNNLLNSSL